MSKSPLRRWLKPLSQRRPATIRRRPRAYLNLERFEDRTVPSSSIPLNGFTWTNIGPSPIVDGQSPGNPSSTGRLDGIAFDPAIVPGNTYPFPNDPNRIYVLSDSAGVWRTSDGGHTWAQQGSFGGGLGQAITEVNRGANDTVYAALSTGFERSTDGGQTFTLTSPFPAGLTVTTLTVDVVNPNNQAQDIIFASLSSSLFFTSGDFGQGIYRSMDGGTTFTRIAAVGTSPFSLSSAEFTDVAFNPANPNIAYAAVGNFQGDPFNGVYRSVNALSTTPTWSLLIGGSQFVPGSTPGNIKIAVSPVQTSVIFASLALRADPQSGQMPLLGVFRSLDSGVNWTPTLIANPSNQTSDPQNYLGISGDDNNVIVVDPFSPGNPLQQRVYVAGFGITGTNTALFSVNSTTTFAMIGIGANGVGPYPNVHQGQIDQQGRFVIGTGGGIYRNESTSPVLWTSLNGNIGPAGLGVSQFYGFALHPTNPDEAIGNIDSTPVLMQNAVHFSDHFGLGNAAYGWGTIDSGSPAFIDTNYGDGVVFYNSFNPSIVYRVTRGGGSQIPVRRSMDGGLTWTGVGNGFPALPTPVSGIGADPGPTYVPPTTIDPSRPNRLFSGYNQVFATDDNGDNWRSAVQTTLAGGTIAIPPLPTTQITQQGGGPVFMDALATGRQTNVGLLGFGTFNGAGVFAATEADALFDPVSGNYMNTALPGSQLFFAVIPDLAPNQWPPPMTNYDNHYWAHITPPGLIGQITQIIADPIINSSGASSSVLYVYSNSGQVFRCTDLSISYTIDSHMNIIPDPTATTATWTDLTSTLPLGSSPVRYPQPLALDKNIVRPGIPPNQPGDRLYVGTVNGVFALDNPRQDFTGTPPNWVPVGGSSLPAVPISTLAINSTTGILAAATYGQGVYELQVRGLIRGRVFEDLNGNGLFDTGEPPFANITVTARNVTTDTTFATATDANGVYEFRSLTAGHYTVTVSGLGGLLQTTAPAEFDVTEQSTLDQVNFGLFRPGSISGMKFGDINGNGILDSGEHGLAGFTIFIDANNNARLDSGELSTVTDSNGFFSFTNLGPGTLNGAPNPATFVGTYPIVEVQQTGFTQTTPNPTPITLTSGQNVTGVLIGNHPPGPGGGTLNHLYAVGADAGGVPVVSVYNAATNVLLSQFLAYSSAFHGGVRVATGDINGDGIADIITAPGVGGGPDIKIFDGASLGLIREFSAYDPNFRGGVYLAVGDINGDGVADIITGAGDGGGPHVRVFSGVDNSVIREWMAYDINFRGGVRVAAGDINGDHRTDVITSPGFGGGPHVKAFSGFNGALLASYMAYAPNYFGGVFVTSGDLNHDGVAEIITGPGVGGGPDLRIFDVVAGTGVLLNEFAPFPPGGLGGQVNSPWVSGLRVGLTDFGGDGQLDIIVGGGPGQRPRIRIFNGSTFGLLLDSQVFGSTFFGGVYVGGN